jgi:hypothetical protein
LILLDFGFGENDFSINQRLSNPALPVCGLLLD